MHNYPPGMTQSDWRHIDGEVHYTVCPTHEDYYPGGGDCECFQISIDQRDDAVEHNAREHSE